MSLEVIATLTVSIITLIINLHQSIVQRNFNSNCCGNTCDYSSTHKIEDHPAPLSTVIPEDTV